jgi:hypothetical protein
VGPRIGLDRCGISRPGIRPLFRLRYPSHLLMLQQYEVQCLLVTNNLSSDHIYTAHEAHIAT